MATSKKASAKAPAKVTAAPKAAKEAAAEKAAAAKQKLSNSHLGGFMDWPGRWFGNRYRCWGHGEEAGRRLHQPSSTVYRWLTKGSRSC